MEIFPTSEIQDASYSYIIIGKVTTIIAYKRNVDVHVLEMLSVEFADSGACSELWIQRDYVSEKLSGQKNLSGLKRRQEVITMSTETSILGRGNTSVSIIHPHTAPASKNQSMANKISPPNV